MPQELLHPVNRYKPGIDGTFEQLWIGQDLHDGLCQELAGIPHAADLITKKLSSNSAPRRVDSFKAHDLELIQTVTVSGALLTS